MEKLHGEKVKYCCSWLHLLHVFLRVALLTCAFLTHEFYSIIFSSVSLQDQILCNRETAGGAGTPDRKAQGGCSNSCWGRLMQQKLKSYTLDYLLLLITTKEIFVWTYTCDYISSPLDGSVVPVVLASCWISREPPQPLVWNSTSWLLITSS